MPVIADGGGPGESAITLIHHTMSLSLSLTADAVSGRRMFLIGSTLGVLSLFLPWYVGQSIIPVFFDMPNYEGASVNGFATGGWIKWAITAVIPSVFLITRQAMPIWAKALTLPLYLAIVILEIAIIRNGQMYSSGLSYFQAGGIGHWIFIATQIVCLIAMLRFPLRKLDHMNSPPLPNHP